MVVPNDAPLTTWRWYTESIDDVITVMIVSAVALAVIMIMIMSTWIIWLLCWQNQLSGYLQRKFKNSNGWQKLWVVFANFCLFFYKNFQVTVWQTHIITIVSYQCLEWFRVCTRQSSVTLNISIFQESIKFTFSQAYCPEHFFCCKHLWTSSHMTFYRYDNCCCC